MASLVRCGSALLGNNRGDKDAASILLKGFLAKTFRERAPTASTVSDSLLHVDVQGAIVAPAKRFLHSIVVLACCPLLIDSPISAFVKKEELGVLESFIEGINLIKGVLSL